MSDGSAGLLVRALAGIPLSERRLIVWRAVLRGRNPRDSSGSRLYAGRWHNLRLTQALYTAEDESTAVAEIRYRLAAGKQFVLHIQEFRLTIPRLLDLLNPAVVSAIVSACAVPRRHAILAPTRRGPWWHGV